MKNLAFVGVRNLVLVICAAFLMIGTVSCTPEDVDASSGKGIMVIKGSKKVSLPYMYWYVTRNTNGSSSARYEYHLEAWSCDIESAFGTGKMPSSMSSLMIDFEADGDMSSIPEGDFDLYHIYGVTGVNANSKPEGDRQFESDYYGNGALKITRDGDIYTIQFESCEASGVLDGDEDNTYVVSFSYKGPLNDMPELIEK